MKLAEALQIRADLQKRISQLEVRLINNATIQEGEEPSENPTELLKELNECLGQLEALISKINKTNNQTQTELGTLCQLIAKRDVLKQKISIYRNVLNEASRLGVRQMRSEIKIKSSFSVPEYQKKLDEDSSNLRKIDAIIQSANWLTELVED